MSMDRKLQRLQEAISAVISGITPAELSRRSEGKWCCGEILEHLNLTYTGTIKNLERCLAAGKSATAGTRKGKAIPRLLLTRIGYFPRGRKSPERVQPRGAPSEQVLVQIIENIARMDQVIADCEQRFGKRLPIADHPVLGPLTAREWRGFHLTHGKHHARQIARLRAYV
jgi:hypothetical protein